MRRAQHQFVTFEAIDITNPPNLKTGINNWVGIDVTISKDGGNFVNATFAPVELTDQFGPTGVYNLELLMSETDATWVHIRVKKAGIQDAHLKFTTTGDPSAQVVANGGNTASTFAANRGESPNDYWKDALIVFTNGALAGQVKKVSAYNSATGFFTVSTPFTGTPAAGDWFLLINI